MLILVAVSITAAVQGGLFENAGKAVKDYGNAQNEEKYANSIIAGTGGYTLPAGTTLKSKTNPSNDATMGTDGILTENATYTDTETKTATIPAGFKVSEVAGESTISTGLVIKDGVGNEFVWIPVTEDLGNSYSGSTNYNEPQVLTSTDNSSGGAYDSQTTLDYWYGTGYYNYANNFNYADEYEDMVSCVNNYDGFYIGRYETTIEGTEVGVKNNKTVLTAGSILKDGTNSNTSGPYYYRWYGLYSAQKNMNIVGNGTTVQTAMIYGILWDKTMSYIEAQRVAGKTTYTVNTATTSWHSGSSVVNSAQANTGDIALNIWDLEGNAYEWTQEAYSSGLLAMVGGYDGSYLVAVTRHLCLPCFSWSVTTMVAVQLLTVTAASFRTTTAPTYGSRPALYIK